MECTGTGISQFIFEAYDDATLGIRSFGHLDQAVGLVARRRRCRRRRVDETCAKYRNLFAVTNKLATYWHTDQVIRKAS